MRRHNLRLSSVAFCALSVSIAYGQSAAPQDEAAFDEIYKEIDRKEFTKANHSLHLTCDKAPVPSCDYYRGMLLHAQGSLLPMANSYELYLWKTHTEPSERERIRRQRVTKELDKIRPNFGLLKSKSDSVTMQFQVDGTTRSVGRGLLWVFPGEHEVSFDGQKERQRVVVSKGETFEVATPGGAYPGAERTKKRPSPTSGRPVLTPAPALAELELKTDLGGMLVSGLKNYDSGLTIGYGETRIAQESGHFKLSATISSQITPLEVEVDLPAGGAHQVNFNWQKVIKRDKSGEGLTNEEWQQFVASKLTPKAYLNRRGNIALVVSGAAFLTAGLIIGGLGIEQHTHNISDQSLPLLGAGAALTAAGVTLLPIGAVFMTKKMPEPGLDRYGKPVRRVRY